MNDYRKRLMFEPNIDLNEEQVLGIENEILDIIEADFGNKYNLYDWRLETKCIVFIDEKTEE